MSGCVFGALFTLNEAFVAHMGTMRSIAHGDRASGRLVKHKWQTDQALSRHSQRPVRFYRRTKFVVPGTPLCSGANGSGHDEFHPDMMNSRHMVAYMNHRLALRTIRVAVADAWQTRRRIVVYGRQVQGEIVDREPHHAHVFSIFLMSTDPV